MNKLRQRIPFKFSSNDEEDEDTWVLDEQGNFTLCDDPYMIFMQIWIITVEQEEVIEALRRDHTLSSQRYYKFLQGCLSFTILL